MGLPPFPGSAGTPRVQDSWIDAARYVKGINACAFPGNTDAEWDKWARRAFAPDGDGRLAPRYDPAIAKALEDGKLRATSPELQQAFRRLAHARPTLLVRGALSDLLEREQADWMRREAPGLQYVEVPDVGHAPMLTEPAALDAVLRFLAGLP